MVLVTVTVDDDDGDDDGDGDGDGDGPSLTERSNRFYHQAQLEETTATLLRTISTCPSTSHLRETAVR